MNKQDFIKLMDQHDWYFRMSDDDRTYREGIETEKRLKSAAKEDPELKALYDARVQECFPANEHELAFSASDISGSEEEVVLTEKMQIRYFPDNAEIRVYFNPATISTEEVVKKLITD